MKTLREVLFERHKAAEPKLEAIRQTVVTEHLKERGCPHPRQAATIPVRERLTAGVIFAKLWQELVWPCRRIWLGMAAVWVVILVFNFVTREKDVILAANPPPSPEMAAALKSQRQMLAQLLNPDTTAQPARPALPKPRSEQRPAVVSV